MLDLTSPRLCTSLLVAGLCSSCTAPPIKVEGTGAPTFSPSARVSYDLSGEGSEPRLQLELDLAHGGGDFEQGLETSEHVTIGGVSFSGPAEVRVSADVTRAYAALRVGGELDQGFGGSALAGLGTSRASITGEQAFVVGSTSLTGWGPLLGLEGHYRLTHSLRLYAELVGMATFPEGADSSSLSSSELGLNWTATRHFELAAGWRWWTFRADSSENDYPVPVGSSVSSDFDLKLSGPMLSLRLAF
jgi:hypothetical protein